MNTQTIQITLTVFFDGRMWVAYFERRCPEGYSVYEESMVKEPTENDLYMWITYGYAEIIFSRPVADDEAQALGPRQLNYKQMQRASRRLLTKADEPVRAREALHAERTQKKREQKAAAKAERDTQAAHKRLVKEAKKKAKKRGR